jgi:hypothetical protein
VWFFLRSSLNRPQHGGIPATSAREPLTARRRIS